MGVIHHSEYIRYFELGRDRWMESLGYGLDKCQAQGLVFPVVKLECRYLKSLRFGETVTVTVQLREFGGAKAVFEQQVLGDDGSVRAEGTVAVGFIDSNAGRICRCPAELAEIFKQQINN